MSIPQLFAQKKPVISLEVFPPKPESPLSVIDQTLSQLSGLKPDYISVTDGAGGTTTHRTTEIAHRIQQDCGCPALGHFTCVGADNASIDARLEAFAQSGVQTILALRGDVPKGMDPEKAFIHFRYASSLIQRIKAHGGFAVAAACYPEGHMESPDQDSDLKHLKLKVDVGAELLVTQLFFSNDAFYDFLDKARAIGIHVPVTAGIMPVLDANQILRMTTLCGASIPAALSKIIARYKDPADFAKAGLDYCCEQIRDLLRNDVNGIHLYTMNRAKSITAILMETGLR